MPVLFKYWLNADESLDPDYMPHGSCLECMLPGVQFTAGLGKFPALNYFKCLGRLWPLLYRFSLLAGPQWDSVKGINIYFIYSPIKDGGLVN